MTKDLLAIGTVDDAILFWGGREFNHVYVRLVMALTCLVHVLKAKKFSLGGLQGSFSK